MPGGAPAARFIVHGIGVRDNKWTRLSADARPPLYAPSKHAVVQQALSVSTNLKTKICVYSESTKVVFDIQSIATPTQFSSHSPPSANISHLNPTIQHSTATNPARESPSAPVQCSPTTITPSNTGKENQPSLKPQSSAPPKVEPTNVATTSPLPRAPEPSTSQPTQRDGQEQGAPTSQSHDRQRRRSRCHPVAVEEQQSALRDIVARHVADKRRSFSTASLPPLPARPLRAGAGAAPLPSASADSQQQTTDAAAVARDSEHGSTQVDISSSEPVLQPSTNSVAHNAPSSNLRTGAAARAISNETSHADAISTLNTSPDPNPSAAPTSESNTGPSIGGNAADKSRENAVPTSAASTAAEKSTTVTENATGHASTTGGMAGNPVGKGVEGAGKCVRKKAGSGTENARENACEKVRENVGGSGGVSAGLSAGKDSIESIDASAVPNAFENRGNIAVQHSNIVADENAIEKAVLVAKAREVAPTKSNASAVASGKERTSSDSNGTAEQRTKPSNQTAKTSFARPAPSRRRLPYKTASSNDAPEEVNMGRNAAPVENSSPPNGQPGSQAPAVNIPGVQATDAGEERITPPSPSDLPIVGTKTHAVGEGSAPRSSIPCGTTESGNDRISYVGPHSVQQDEGSYRGRTSRSAPSEHGAMLNSNNAEKYPSKASSRLPPGASKLRGLGDSNKRFLPALLRIVESINAFETDAYRRADKENLCSKVWTTIVNNSSSKRGLGKVMKRKFSRGASSKKNVLSGKQAHVQRFTSTPIVTPPTAASNKGKQTSQKAAMKKNATHGRTEAGSELSKLARKNGHPVSAREDEAPSSSVIRNNERHSDAPTNTSHLELVDQFMKKMPSKLSLWYKRIARSERPVSEMVEFMRKVNLAIVALQEKQDLLKLVKNDDLQSGLDEIHKGDSCVAALWETVEKDLNNYHVVTSWKNGNLADKALKCIGNFSEYFTFIVELSTERCNDLLRRVRRHDEGYQLQNDSDHDYDGELTSYEMCVSSFLKKRLLESGKGDNMFAMLRRTWNVLPSKMQESDGKPLFELRMKLSETLSNSLKAISPMLSVSLAMRKEVERVREKNYSTARRGKELKSASDTPKGNSSGQVGEKARQHSVSKDQERREVLERRRDVALKGQGPSNSRHGLDKGLLREGASDFPIPRKHVAHREEGGGTRAGGDVAQAEGEKQMSEWTNHELGRSPRKRRPELQNDETRELARRKIYRNESDRDAHSREQERSSDVGRARDRPGDISARRDAASADFRPVDSRFHRDTRGEATPGLPVHGTPVSPTQPPSHRRENAAPSGRDSADNMRPRETSRRNARRTTNEEHLPENESLRVGEKSKADAFKGPVSGEQSSGTPNVHDRVAASYKLPSTVNASVGISKGAGNSVHSGTSARPSDANVQRHPSQNKERNNEKNVASEAKPITPKTPFVQGNTNATANGSEARHGADAPAEPSGGPVSSVKKKISFAAAGSEKPCEPSVDLAALQLQFVESYDMFCESSVYRDLVVGRSNRASRFSHISAMSFIANHLRDRARGLLGERAMAHPGRFGLLHVPSVRRQAARLAGVNLGPPSGGNAIALAPANSHGVGSSGAPSRSGNDPASPSRVVRPGVALRSVPQPPNSVNHQSNQ